ncbi:hypothetical protein CHELA1G11_20592 [Hyphomicrobiales bacterium]|nr:hypothetical protein CHELA1G11_20592 [Hyphomicrobiales bacterium]CAH1690964.1 hypothetical protein CHELA1G2_20908 [Hyphomicrobiales bacterium]
MASRTPPSRPRQRGLPRAASENAVLEGYSVDVALISIGHGAIRRRSPLWRNMAADHRNVLRIADSTLQPDIF